jgi:hypothetical protein
MSAQPVQLIDQSGFDSFVRWFNQNPKGETIYAADLPTLRRRIQQWAHLDGLMSDGIVALAADIHAVREAAE